MRTHLITLLAVSLALAGTAQAKIDSSPAKDGAVQLDVQETVAEQLARVERALATEEYSEVGLEDKGKVQAALGRIRTKVGDHATIAQVNPQFRTEIYNDQELINTILTRAHADSRVVCRRERTTGSNRPTQVCMTVAQRREMMENSRDALRNYNRVNPKTDSL